MKLIAVLTALAVSAGTVVVTLSKYESYADPSGARFVVESVNERVIQVSIKGNGKTKETIDRVSRNECIAWRSKSGWRHATFLDWEGPRVRALFDDGRGVNCYEPYR